jgi:hypothetical protein
MLMMIMKVNSEVNVCKATVAILLPCQVIVINCPISYNESTDMILRDGGFTELHGFAETQTWFV